MKNATENPIFADIKPRFSDDLQKIQKDTCVKSPVIRMMHLLDYDPHTSDSRS